jgi:ribosomal protein L30/L7E
VGLLETVKTSKGIICDSKPEVVASMKSGSGMIKAVKNLVEVEWGDVSHEL